MQKLLSVNIGITLVKFGDILRWNFIGYSHLQRDPDRFGHIFDHHRGFEGFLPAGTDGEYAMIFEQAGR